MAYSNSFRRSQYLFTHNAVRVKTLNKQVSVFRGGITL